MMSMSNVDSAQCSAGDQEPKRAAPLQFHLKLFNKMRYLSADLCSCNIFIILNRPHNLSTHHGIQPLYHNPQHHQTHILSLSLTNFQTMARPTALLPPRQTNAPLESVVIPSPAPPPKKNANNSNNTTTTSIGKNIQVIIRLRPLLASDSSAAAAAATTAKRITRSTTRHTSGLITPTNNSKRSSTSASNNDNNNSNTTAQEPAWQTPTPYTIIQNPTIKQDNSISGSKSDVAYTFDRVYGCDSTNDEIYQCSVGDVVKSCVEGFHGSVFAYGQVRRFLLINHTS